MSTVKERDYGFFPFPLPGDGLDVPFVGFDGAGNREAETIMPSARKAMSISPVNVFCGPATSAQAVWKRLS